MRAGFKSVKAEAICPTDYRDGSEMKCDVFVEGRLKGLSSTLFKVTID